MLVDTHVLKVIDEAFGGVAKPEHFTNYLHCEECAEHDETLRLHDRATLKIEHVENPGWDPLCFTSPEGKAYYLPTLARFALAPPTYEYSWYGDQLLFHLTSGGQYNEFLGYCTAEQRHAIALLLEHVITTHASAPEVLSSQDELLRAHELWSTYRPAGSAA